ASGTRKPDGLVLVPPGTEADFLAPLPIGVIPGLGPKTEERLHAMGLRNVGALAAYETQRLVQALGTNGAVLQRLAQGRDRAPVDGSKPAKTISAETTFDKARFGPRAAAGARPARHLPCSSQDSPGLERSGRETPSPSRARRRAPHAPA